ncbi:hypothetical protein Bbelb_204400 [Branchiostoma belcheri]|nr:hypothetical protein Bbelb_204400 [Branchiostoma belcheri]
MNEQIKFVWPDESNDSFFFLPLNLRAGGLKRGGSSLRLTKKTASHDNASAGVPTRQIAEMRATLDERLIEEISDKALIRDKEEKGQTEDGISPPGKESVN